MEEFFVTCWPWILVVVAVIVFTSYRSLRHRSMKQTEKSAIGRSDGCGFAEKD